MPEMDGQALYEEIQRDHPQILKRIVFVTAQAHSSDYGPFLRTTGIPVIEKPFTLSQLRQAVSRMVGPTR
jgi:two-component system NtrC family sensor kinase